MYARSLVPSDASISRRISSSDAAIASTSASLRCAYSATSAIATLHHIPRHAGKEPSKDFTPSVGHSDFFTAEPTM